MSGITQTEHSGRAKKMLISSNYMFFLFGLTYYFLLLVVVCLYIIVHQGERGVQLLFGLLIGAIVGHIVMFPFLKEKAL